MKKNRVVMQLYPAKCCMCGSIPSEYVQGKYSWFHCDKCNVSAMPCLTSKEAVDVWNSYNTMEDVREDIETMCDSELDITKI